MGTTQETTTSMLSGLEWGVDFNALQTYSRDLPHWRQEGAVYFVTFRLRDSIPKQVLDWMLERKRWLNANGVPDHLADEERLKRYLAIPEPKRRAFEREEARKFLVELDRCHGSCILRKPDAAEIVGGALRYFHGTRLYCGDFVVMPNHVHWLVIPMHGHQLESILHSVKRYSARQINLLLKRTGRVWQKESFDRIVRNPDEFERTRTYIQNNPVAARLKSKAFLHYAADWAATPA